MELTVPEIQRGVGLIWINMEEWLVKKEKVVVFELHGTTFYKYHVYNDKSNLFNIFLFRKIRVSRY